MAPCESSVGPFPIFGSPYGVARYPLAVRRPLSDAGASRRNGAHLARAAWLLLALAACGAGSADSRTPPFDPDRAWSDLETVVGFGPRPAGSAALDELREWLVAQLSEAGLEPVREEFEADTPLGPIEMENVYADLPGRAGARGNEPPLVILCSHIDTKRLDFPFVGANDAGSSTAVLLELARALAATAPHPLAYRFLFVDGEEALRERWEGRDNTYGSRHHAARLAADGRAEGVAAAIVIDMVGDRDLRLTRDTNSDPRLLDAFEEAAHEARLGHHVWAPRQAVKDDHLSFMRVGIPSANLIDLEFGPDNDWWHSPEDSLENCSRESLAAIGRIVLGGLERLEDGRLSALRPR